MKSSSQNVEISIRRYKLGQIDPPRFQNYTVLVGADSNLTILDCLEEIRLNQDSTLIYRHSCHHSSCGTCACLINGIPRLACTTQLRSLPLDQVITLEPLKGFECIADLAVNMEVLFKDIDIEWSYLKTDESDKRQLTPEGIEVWQQLEDCIECGCCISACPQMQATEGFMGPAALTAINNQGSKSPKDRKKLLALAGGDRGVEHCKRVLACSRVCPTRVYPSRHIEDLRRQLK
jgi:succinate dehydrogenase / fumarate reductase iron-sulfur subunit